MAAKAQKLRTKRANRGAGRPRKEGVERFPSGKVKPSETQKETMSVAIDARRRIHGMEAANDDMIKKQYAGYTLGRIYLDGKITEEQLMAGDEFSIVVERYFRMTGAPSPNPRAQSLFNVAGHDGEQTDDQASRARRATNKMMELQRVLLLCEDGPQVKSTVYNVVVLDLDHLRGMHPQQMLYLKRGLNALKDHKGRSA
jgi:hypothetical protein